MSETKTADAPATPPETPPATPPPESTKVAETKVEPPATPPVPDKYDLKLKDKSPLQKGDVEEVEAFAKANKLSIEQAQKMVADQEAYHDKFASRQRQAAIEQQNSWKREVESDRDIAGPDGKMLKENVEIAHRGLKMFADESFVKVLNETGLGNNPHLIRTFMRIGKRFQDDKQVSEGKMGPTPKVKDVAERFYPSHSKKKE